MRAVSSTTLGALGTVGPGHGQGQGTGDRGTQLTVYAAKWSRVVSLAGALGAAASALMSSAGLAGAATSSQTWSDYFYPLKVGWTCHEALDSAGITGTETLTITAVAKVRDGHSVSVTEGSSTSVNGTNVPTNSVLHYVLTNNGHLVSVPSAGQFAGQPYEIRGDTTLPSVHTLLSGGTGTSELHISEPLNQSQLAQVGSILTPHATALDMEVVLRERGHHDAALTTPMGTFHNVLAVQATLGSIRVTDAVKGASKALTSELQPVLGKDLANTTWYAPGVGPVRFDVGGIQADVTNAGSS